MEQQENKSSLTNEEKDESRLGKAPLKEEILFSWKAPIRPFKKRDREFFTTVLIIALLLGLILFFLEGILPVAVIIAVVFLVYVLSTVPPEVVEHKITNKGIVFAETNKHPWEEFTRFWFTHRFNSELLVLESLRIGGRMEMVVSLEDKDKIRDKMEEYLPQEETAPNFLDKSAAWLSKKVMLDRE